MLNRFVGFFNGFRDWVGFLKHYLHKTITTWMFNLSDPEPLEEDLKAGDEEAIVDNYDAIFDRLIHAMAVNNHSYSDITKLEVLCNTADDYIQLLKMASMCLNGAFVFPSSELAIRTIKVCNFYRDPDGGIGNITIKRGKLLNEMLSFTQLYRSVENMKTRPGHIEHAFRRCLTIMINISELSVQFVQPRLEQ